MRKTKTKTLFRQGGFIMKTKTNKMISVIMSLLMILNISFIFNVEMFKETKVHSETISFDDKVINELIKLETRINVSEYKLTTAEAMTKFWQVISDNPRLFFVKLFFFLPSSSVVGIKVKLLNLTNEWVSWVRTCTLVIKCFY